MSQTITIQDVKTILTQPAGSRLIVVKIITSQPGLYGLGCATFTQRFHAVHAAIEKHLKPFLIGRDVTRIEETWPPNSLARTKSSPGPRPACRMAALPDPERPCGSFSLSSSPGGIPMDNDPKAPAQITEKIAGDIIVAEFNYITNTAFQANEDRARVSQFFFVTFGTIVAALFTSQLTDVDLHQIYTAFGILFVLLAVFGGLTLLQLARLRLAWLESARAMNHIKENIGQEFPHLQPYFRWTLATLPPAYKTKSVGSILAFMVALLSGLAIASSVAFFGLALNPDAVPWLLSLLSFLLGAAGSFFNLYRRPLNRS